MIEVELLPGIGTHGPFGVVERHHWKNKLPAAVTPVKLSDTGTPGQGLVGAAVAVPAVGTPEQGVVEMTWKL